MHTIEDRITTILLEHFQIDPDLLQPGATFADLNFDSLVLVELVLVLSNDLGVPLADNALDDGMTISDAAKAIAAVGTVA